MTKNPTTSFRFDDQVLERLDRLASVMRCSRAEVIRRSLTLFEMRYAGVHGEAERFINRLCERYGDNAMITVIPRPFISTKGGIQVLSGGPDADVYVNGERAEDADGVVVETLKRTADGVLEGVGLQVHLHDLAPSEFAPINVRIGMLPPNPPEGVGLTVRISDLKPGNVELYGPPGVGDNPDEPLMLAS